MSVRTLTPPASPVGDLTIAAPAAVGGGTVNTMARWDVVPYQTVTGTLKAGVVAFHEDGIDRVDFRVDGGAWVSATSMTLNSDTGVVEYWTTFDASVLSDGPHTAQAIAYPTSGTPRVVGDLVLTANAGGTLSQPVQYVAASGGSDSNDGLTAGAPKATIAAAIAAGKAANGGLPDGLTIYLLAGTYVIDSSVFANRFVAAMSRWMTITQAPGVAKSAVVINGMTGTDGIVQKLVRFKGVTFHQQVNGAPSAYVTSYIWRDDCAFSGQGVNRWDTSFRDGQGVLQFATGCSYTNCLAGPDGNWLVRDVTVNGVAQTGFHDCYLVINSTADDINRGSNTDLHPDGWQLTAGQYTPNMIAYGVTVTNLNLTGVRIQESGQDIALVNCNFDSGSHPYVWEIERPYDNIFIKGGTWTGGFVYTGTVSTTDVVFEGVTFSSPPGARAGVTIRSAGEEPMASIGTGTNAPFIGVKLAGLPIEGAFFSTTTDLRDLEVRVYVDGTPDSDASHLTLTAAAHQLDYAYSGTTAAGDTVLIALYDADGVFKFGHRYSVWAATASNQTPPAISIEMNTIKGGS